MKKFLNVDNVFSNFHSYHPLLKTVMVEHTLLFFNSGCCMLRLVEIGPAFLNDSGLMLSMYF